MKNEKKPKFLQIKEDSRPPRYYWASGDYWCKCKKCGADYMGDKRSRWCADCAYDYEKPIDYQI